MDGKELTNEEALQIFLLDIGCLDELLPWTGKFNMFDVLSYKTLFSILYKNYTSVLCKKCAFLYQYFRTAD